MSNVFGSIYADNYDALYQDKDYEAECDLLESVFNSHGDGAIHSILDLGCGTGNHAIPLVRRGYKVVGVDRSEEMLAQARRKAVALSDDGSLVFHQAEIHQINEHGPFDAALMMFAVLGYQISNRDVLAALGAARGHLAVGGLLIFDTWYGPAVLHERPAQRIKVLPTTAGQTLRVASGQLDVRRHLCEVNYRVWKMEGEQLVAQTEEGHLMRYFFPMELELFLESSGFDLIRLAAFPNIDQEPDDTTWNILVIARAA